MIEPTVQVTHGPGWYEWINISKATTHVSYVHENGSVYIPESDVTVDDFKTAINHGRAYRLLRMEDAT